MLNFKTFELDCLSQFVPNLVEYTDNNLRYPKVGELIEMAYEIYSNGQLKRVNQPGVDLITPDGVTYESKVTQFRNKSQMAVRSLILKNRRAAKDYKDKLADYFIITDIKKGTACCIPSSKLYNFKDNGATLTAHADPTIDDFFLTGCKSKDESSDDYFTNAEKFDYEYIKSFRK
jgi:hypothetical protein|tara:strand:+ start:489 stop:1013 length:525 start_codon:yes stop_codon:yes gene_type:complete